MTFSVLVIFTNRTYGYFILGFSETPSVSASRISIFQQEYWILIIPAIAVLHQLSSTWKWIIQYSEKKSLIYCSSSKSLQSNIELAQEAKSGKTAFTEIDSDMKNKKISYLSYLWNCKTVIILFNVLCHTITLN